MAPHAPDPLAALHSALAALLPVAPEITLIAAPPPATRWGHRSGRVVHAVDFGAPDRHATLSLPEGPASAAQLQAIAPLATLVLQNGHVSAGLQHQIARLSRDNATLRQAARHDALTGLQNHASFRADVEARLRSPATDRTGVLVLADLDAFKAVNDRHGHAHGDRYLATFARTLRAATRAADLTARIGGDEFALFLEGQGLTARFVDSLTARISRRFAREIGHSPALAGPVSFGTALRGGTTCYDTLFEQADAALYRAKHARQPRRAGDRLRRR